jgi:hypothetical protein
MPTTRCQTESVPLFGWTIYQQALDMTTGEISIAHFIDGQGDTVGGFANRSLQHVVFSHPDAVSPADIKSRFYKRLLPARAAMQYAPIEMTAPDTDKRFRGVLLLDADGQSVAERDTSAVRTLSDPCSTYVAAGRIAFQATGAAEDKDFTPVTTPDTFDGIKALQARGAWLVEVA